MGVNRAGSHRWVAFGLAIGLATGALGPATARAQETDPAWTAAWDRVLDEYTHTVGGTVGTVVDYRGLMQEPGRTLWREVLAGLGRAPSPAAGDEAMAYWINAYNVLAIDTVLRAWPLESIRDAGNLLWPVWRREAGRASGRTVSLHEVEHEILRPLGDPRIHAAIVCASTSCPSLRREPFRADELDAQLDDALRRFLANDRKGLRIDRSRGRASISRIFDWFEEDFESRGGVRATLVRYAPEADRAWLEARADDLTISHFDYDWTLNDWKRSGSASDPGAP